MLPVSPVVPGFEENEIVIAKDQPEYIPLPAIITGDGVVFTRWKLDWRERLRLLFKGDMYLQVHTFGRPLQPVMMTVEAPVLTRNES